MKEIEVTFEELYELVQSGKKIQIESPDGTWENIIDSYKKSGNGKKIIYSDGSFNIGSDYHLILTNIGWKTFNELTLGDIILGKNYHPEKYVDEIIEHGNDDWYDFAVDTEEQAYLQNGLIHHNSGKSLIIYLVIMATVHFYAYDRFLIVVPTIQLVNQLKRDFEDYSNSTMSHLIHEIQGGVEKDSNKPIVISTWQSVYKQPESWFSRTSEKVGFDAIICDEVHGFASDCTKAIVEKSKHVECKLGFSGTLSNSKVGELVLTGLFGDVYNAITTKQLIDNGQIANIKVYGIPLNWNVDCNKIAYQDEIKAIVVNRNRNKIIAKLAIGQTSNSLLLFNEIDHLNNLRAELVAIDPNRANKIFVVTGATESEYRTKVSLLCEKVDGIIILATYQVFQQGISINNLHNLFLVRPSKSTIRILQSIGRILRLNNNKDVAKVFDFFDIIVKTKNGDGSNTTFQHFKERYKTYIKQKFNVVIMPKVNLNNKINIE